MATMATANPSQFRVDSIRSSTFFNAGRCQLSARCTAAASLRRPVVRPLRVNATQCLTVAADKSLSHFGAIEERSYVMVKPDGVQRGHVGEIISRFERKGFQLIGLKLFKTPKELAEEHYGELKEKPFYGKLVDYIISGPVVCIALEGPGVVASARKLIGATNPLNAEPGTIRGDLGIEVGRNVVHGSDSPENGLRELGLWFDQDELIEWEQHMTPWLKE
uniref:Nucleoside diphosphate kinase n=1 Tax=Physcomitrium patens TaxID=3218 RepID=A0A7I4AG49_PHYPA